MHGTLYCLYKIIFSSAQVPKMLIQSAYAGNALAKHEVDVHTAMDGDNITMPYTSHPHHRSAAFASQKSQWSIAINEEEICYSTATVKSWTCGGCYWGLHLTGLAPSVLGVAPQPVHASLHIAKFVGDESGNWHGYPVAHWLSPFDKPGVTVLMAWLLTRQ